MSQWKRVALRDRTTCAARAWELCDLEPERSELKNLANEMPERVAAVEAARMAWGAKVGWVPFEQLGCYTRCSVQSDALIFLTIAASGSREASCMRGRGDSSRRRGRSWARLCSR